jgi:hypothetical protein
MLWIDVCRDRGIQGGIEHKVGRLDWCMRHDDGGYKDGRKKGKPGWNRMEQDGTRSGRMWGRCWGRGIMEWGTPNPHSWRGKRGSWWGCRILRNSALACVHDVIITSPTQKPIGAHNCHQNVAAELLPLPFHWCTPHHWLDGTVNSGANAGPTLAVFGFSKQLWWLMKMRSTTTGKMELQKTAWWHARTWQALRWMQWWQFVAIIVVVYCVWLTGASCWVNSVLSPLTPANVAMTVCSDDCCCLLCLIHSCIMLGQ